MKICIAGGGLTGLSAALELTRAHDVVIYEKLPFSGGCLSSYTLSKGTTIERFYHHCFQGDNNLFSLLSKLDLTKDLEWLKGTTGYHKNGVTFPLTSPPEILKYPYLTFFDKLRIGLLSFRSKKVDTVRLDGISARDYIINKVGERAYNDFFLPLLTSKFGENKDSVSAAWLMSRIAIRSDRGLEGERLGYIKGGFSKLIDGMEGELRKSGCEIKLSSPVSTIKRSGSSWEVNGTLYDTILSTIPPREFTRLSGEALPDTPYQGAACMTLGLDRDIANGIYWVNMADKAPYGALIAHTNFVPFKRYGEHIVYLASYFSGQTPKDKREDMKRDLLKRFKLPSDAILWDKMAVDPWAGPVYTVRYRELIPKYEQKGYFIAGMFSPPNYPERSMEGSIVAGQEVAEKMKCFGEKFE